MSRNITFASGEYYHLYNRGTEKRKIFLSKYDFERFLALLYLCNSEKSFHMADIIPRGSTSWDLGKVLQQDRGETLVDICAYVLMPNHFHLVVREHSEGGISKFMQKLTTAYTMYFNTRQRRSGSLFQGKFKAEHAGEDRYLKYLISYIHLNPIKLIDSKWKENGIQNKKAAELFLEKYYHSSYRDYCKESRIENTIVNTSALPDYFESASDFITTTKEWLNYRDN